MRSVDYLKVVQDEEQFPSCELTRNRKQGQGSPEGITVALNRKFGSSKVKLKKQERIHG